MEKRSSKKWIKERKKGVGDEVKEMIHP